MRDRELLASDGLVLIAANINPRTKTIICGPEVLTKGFTITNDQEEIINKIKQTFYLVSSKYLITKFIKWADFKMGLKNEISYLIYKEIKRNPIIIPVLISTDLDGIKKESQ